jgi:subtilisin family serine protease
MRTIARFISVGVVLILGAPADVRAGSLTRDLEEALRPLGPEAEISVIATLSDRLDPAVIEGRGDRGLRRAGLVRALREKAQRTQGPVSALLDAKGARALRPLWINNSIAFRARADLVRELAEREDVAFIGLDSTLGVPETTYAASASPEWNLGAIRAPELWSLGHGGSGVVVATMDTGVDPLHPDLATKWRGGSNSWFDPHGENALPRDPFGHGTQVLGILVGGDAGGTAIGVAPFAQWVAVKVFNDAGWATLSGIHSGFQWVLDPDGDPATDDLPDVVNNSWGLASTVNQCNTEFAADIAALRAAEVAVVFAAGNSGPDAATSVSPANDPGSFAVGATNESSGIADMSSRGPSACGGALYPGVVAPGVNVRTSDLTYGGVFPDSYVSATGTSFAAPHLSGAMALLRSAFPQASVAVIEAALVQGALDLGPAGADNAYGNGLVDVSAAYGLLAAGLGSPPTITSTPVTTATEGSLYLYQVAASDPEGTAIAFSLDTAPGGMTVGPATGFVTWTPDGTQVGAHPVVVRATDGSGLASTQSFTVIVAAVAHRPVAWNDGYAATAGVTLSVAAPGVLGNDGDPDGEPLAAVLASGPAYGTLALGGDGSFAYTPGGAFAGTDSFTYRASDGQLLSEPATVTLTVVAPNQPPVAANDAFTAPVRRKASYTPQVLGVLANDRDGDGSLVPSSVRIVTVPSQGGTAAVRADGTVSYTPKQRFKGTESFTYDVADDRGATSNVATVTINVQ